MKQNVYRRLNDPMDLPYYIHHLLRRTGLTQQHRTEKFEVIVYTNDTYTVAEVYRSGCTMTGIGVSKCCPTDKQSTDIGSKIAVVRALRDWKMKYEQINKEKVT